MNENRINWYPGHMAKARRVLEEQLSRTDLVIEVCDARLPYSSRNPDLIKMIRGNKHLLVLNKADLADDEATKQWLSYFREAVGLNALPVNSTRIQRNKLLSLIENETKDLIEKASSRGIRKTVKAMVIGVPNAGKSTLINSLKGSTAAKTGDRPGVTRNAQWVRIHPYLELMDSPGLLWPRLDDQDAARKLCYIGTIKDDIIDLESLTVSLLSDLADVKPDSLKKRFHITDTGLRGTDLLDAVCQGRGWLQKGNEYDYERASHVVPDEFRAGQLGKITLEYPSRGPL